MKLEDSPSSAMTPTNSASPALHLSKAAPVPQASTKLVRQQSSASTIQRRHQYMAYQRRQNVTTTTNDFLNQHTPSTFSVPLLAGAMNEFFQATKIMEEEIMLPSRLKDMPVDEAVLDSSVQPNNWHELYTFVRDTRNQLTRSRPFVDNDNHSDRSEMKESNDDEGILLASHENTAHSSASSSVVSDELEQSITSSNVASFDTIRDELKYHYFGLLGSLDNLTGMAKRVTEKYRDEAIFKI